MPMPKPRTGQTKNEFITVCMGNPVMKREFKSKNQRFAVCNDIWKKKDKKK